MSGTVQWTENGQSTVDAAGNLDFNAGSWTVGAPDPPTQSPTTQATGPNPVTLDGRHSMPGGGGTDPYENSGIFVFRVYVIFRKAYNNLCNFFEVAIFA